MISKEDFNEAYFDGNIVENPHPAGYTAYIKTPVWTKVAEDLVDMGVTGKVLEIGCAKGYLIEELSALGITDIQGVDVSAYAHHASKWETSQKITLACVHDHIGTCLDNEFDYVISRHFFSTQTDGQIDLLIPELNRIAKNQIHIFFNDPVVQYYNNKSLGTWGNYPWQSGSVLIMQGDQIIT